MMKHIIGQALYQIFIILMIVFAGIKYIAF